jgi:hypothetical protein
MLMDRGMPLISGIPVNEPLRYEYPALKRFTGLTRLSIMNYINKEVRYKNNYHNNIGYMNISRVIVLKWKEYSIRNLKYSNFKLNKLRHENF